MARTVDYRGDLSSRGDGRDWTWKARQPFVPPVKAALRAFGMVTAGLRPGPDFLLIGAKRGGSTSIYRNLVATPGVVGLFPGPADIKGTYYFGVEFHRSAAWYRSHFASRRMRAASPDVDGSPAICGEASPYYLSHPHAPARAAAFAPDARIIVALRDPVERAHSHYMERVRQGIETKPTFAEAIEAEPERLAGEWHRMIADPTYVSANHLNFGYLAQSEYDASLARWLAAFGDDQFLVLRSEDFYADERRILADVRAFLGLTAVDLPDPRHFNATVASPIDAGLAAELRDRLRPSVDALQGRLGRDFGWF